MARSRYIQLSALSLMLGGACLVVGLVQNVVVFLLTMFGLTGLFLLHTTKGGTLQKFSFLLASVGTVILFSLKSIPLFYENRYTDPSVLDGPQLVEYLAGVGLFFILVGVFAVSYMALGVVIIRAGFLPSALGIWLILSVGLIIVTGEFGRIALGGTFTLLGLASWRSISNGLKIPLSTS